MIKRTLYFGNPAYLSLHLEQLVVRPAGSQGKEGGGSPPRTIPIEDIGIVILDHQQITVSHALLDHLLENNCSVITCSANHLPHGLLLPLSGNTLQNERYRYQIEASLPLKKQLWQQTVQMKISNQAAVLEQVTGKEHPNMDLWAKSVNSGDTRNLEAQAAAYYWKNLFADPHFIRGRFDGGQNILLNYGYAILRAIIARSLVGSGLLPTLGIHHHNRYNAYCLADDIMEPYRPYIDRLVFKLIQCFGEDEEITLTKECKVQLLSIPVMDVSINGRKSPLSIAANTTTASLVKCFSGENRKIAYPEMR